MINREEYQNIVEYLRERDRIKNSMEKLTNETAQELGYDRVNISNYGGDMTSREIGIHAGPVGGVVVQKLIANAEKILADK